MIHLLDNDIVIRSMHDTENDYALMTRWLSDERIAEFYGGRDIKRTPESVKELYQARIFGTVPVTPCIIEYGSKPIGFIQFYPAVGNLPDTFEPLVNQPDVYGIDMFLGETDFWGKGIGTNAVRLLVHYLFEEKHAVRIIVDPFTENKRAIKMYEKAGFIKHRRMEGIEKHEGVLRDFWLMLCERKI